MNALKAKVFYRRDVQYIVRDGKAIIINEVLSDLQYFLRECHSFIAVCVRIDDNILFCAMYQ